jgi:hypothetical protein
MLSSQERQAHHVSVKGNGAFQIRDREASMVRCE